jgi:hypothetical protein
MRYFVQPNAEVGGVGRRWRLGDKFKMDGVRALGAAWEFFSGEKRNFVR